MNQTLQCWSAIVARYYGTKTFINQMHYIHGSKAPLSALKCYHICNQLCLALSAANEIGLLTNKTSGHKGEQPLILKSIKLLLKSWLVIFDVIMTGSLFGHIYVYVYVRAQKKSIYLDPVLGNRRWVRLFG